LARPAAESRHGGLYFASGSYLFLFLTIPVTPIISKFTRPIVAKFSGLAELWL